MIQFIINGLFYTCTRNFRISKHVVVEEEFFFTVMAVMGQGNSNTLLGITVMKGSKNGICSNDKIYPGTCQKLRVAKAFLFVLMLDGELIRFQRSNDLFPKDMGVLVSPQRNNNPFGNNLAVMLAYNHVYDEVLYFCPNERKKSCCLIDAHTMKEIDSDQIGHLSDDFPRNVIFTNTHPFGGFIFGHIESLQGKKVVRSHFCLTYYSGTLVWKHVFYDEAVDARDRNIEAFTTEHGIHSLVLHKRSGTIADLILNQHCLVTGTVLTSIPIQIDAFRVSFIRNGILVLRNTNPFIHELGGKVDQLDLITFRQPPKRISIFRFIDVYFKWSN